MHAVAGDKLCECVAADQSRSAGLLRRSTSCPDRPGHQLQRRSCARKRTLSLRAHTPGSQMGEGQGRGSFARSVGLRAPEKRTPYSSKNLIDGNSRVPVAVRADAPAVLGARRQAHESRQFVHGHLPVTVAIARAVGRNGLDRK